MTHLYHPHNVDRSNHYSLIIFFLVLNSVFLTTKAQVTFEQRGAAIIDEYAVGTVPGDIPKYGFWYAQANFVKGQDMQGREVLTQTLAGTPADPSFAYWGCMDAYLRWNSTHYTDELKELTKDFMTSFTGYGDGSTQNHRIMLAAARFLASEQWPASDFASGSEYASDDPTGKNYILFRLNEWVRRGVIEHDSPIYITFHLGPVRTLADHATDPEVRQLAILAFEWLMINSANEWMEGHYAASSLRNLFPYDAQNEYYETDMTLWLYFGGKTPENLNLGSLPRACFSIGSIVSDYRLPNIIVDLANKRDQPFLSRESHAVNTEWRLDFRKSTFMERNRYALYSQAELPPGQNAGLNEQSHRWGVVWQSINGANQKSAFWMKHGRRDISRNRAGTTKYEQVLQKDRTLVAIYDIPGDDDFPFAEGFVSNDLSAFIDTPDKIYFHYGSVLIAVLSVKELSWNEGDERIRSDHLKNGLAIETANPERYPGDPMAQLEAFRTEIESIDRFEGSDVEADNPVFVYQSIYGHSLEIAYNQHRRIDGGTIDYTSWPLMSNPWVQQDIDSDMLLLNLDGVLRTYDFANLKVIEGPGEVLPVPTDLEALVISSSEIRLLWQDTADETGFVLQRKTEETEFGTIAELEADVIEYLDTVLTPNTTYSYRIQAIGEVNNSFFSDPVFATTLKVPPDSPDSLAIVQTFFDRVLLTWADRSETEEGFLIQRKQGSEQFSTIATLLPQNTAFTDSTLNEPGVYAYRVLAFNNGGEGVSREVEISFKKKIKKLILHPSCSQDPSYERRWEVFNPNNFNVKFSWKGFGMKRIQKDEAAAPPGKSYFFTSAASLLNVAKIFWQDERGRWHFRIRFSRGQQCDLPVPAVPEEVVVATKGIGRVQVTWKDVADNEDSYEIERQDEDGFKLVGTVGQNTASFTDKGLTEGESYTYRVRSFNHTFGHSTYSENATGATASAIAYYRLDNNTLDENGINNATNSGVGFIQGLFKGAGDFNGVDSYITIPSGILGSAKGAVALWFKTLQDSRGMIFYGSAENSGNGFGPDLETHLNISRDGELEFYNEGANDTELTAGAVNDGNWHMAVASWDIDGKIDLYLDGTLGGSAVHGGEPFIFSANIYLGRPSDDRRYFEGQLDEIKLYDVPLTASEVRNIYENGLAIISPVAKTDYPSARIMGAIGKSEQPSTGFTLLYPNPATSGLNIMLPKKGSWNISITDIAGKSVVRKWSFSTTDGGQRVSIDVGRLNKGLYLVHLIHGESQYVRKLMIEN